jgi:redox-sensitive bicupin YhaK (pirin superfamily)
MGARIHGIQTWVALPLEHETMDLALSTIQHPRFLASRAMPLCWMSLPDPPMAHVRP